MRNKKYKVLGVGMLFLMTTGFERVSKDENPARWKELVWEHGGFSVELPDNSNSPEYLDSELELPGRTGKIAAHTVVGYDGDVVYMVHYCDLPPGASDTYLEDKLKDIGQKWRGKFRYRSISLGRYPGIEYKVRSKHEFGVFRHYLVKQRLFILTVSNLKQAKTPKNLNTFLNSFRLIQTDK